MGKIKDKMMDFLENGGFELGFHENMIPNIGDTDIILKNDIKVWEYMGYRSEKSFYSQRKPSTLAIKEIVKKYGMNRKDYWEKPKQIEYKMPKLIEYKNDNF